MTELRLMLQYGDYLALSLEDLKSSTFSGAIWKGTEWLSVAKSLENENTLRNQLRIGLVKDPEPYLPLDDTPFSNEVAKAAKILGKTTKQVVFEIEAYAARNQACHNDVKNLIHKCHWSKLAELLSSDLLALKSLFKLDVARQSAWRGTIHALSQKYFEYLYRDGETPMFVLTDFANKKTKKQIVKLAKGPEAGASTPTPTGNDSDL